MGEAQKGVLGTLLAGSWYLMSTAVPKVPPLSRTDNLPRDVKVSANVCERCVQKTRLPRGNDRLTGCKRQFGGSEEAQVGELVCHRGNAKDRNGRNMDLNIVVAGSPYSRKLWGTYEARSRERSTKNHGLRPWPEVAPRGRQQEITPEAQSVSNE